MKYEPSHLADISRIKKLTDLWYGMTGIPLAATGPDGSLLAESGGQDLCGRFYRLGRGAGRGAAKARTLKDWGVEKCGNGLACASLRITLSGGHAGSLVAGPFFLRPPDMGFLGRQARQLGLDESASMEALSRLPVVGEARVRTFLEFFSLLAEILFEAGAGKVAARSDRQGQSEKGLDAASYARDAEDAEFRAGSRLRAEGKGEGEEDIASNMKGRVLPCLERLKRSGLSAGQAAVIEMLESALKEITSPAVRKMQTLGFTARQTAVASLLKEGRTTKEIAGLLGVSARAVEFHCYNIEKNWDSTTRKRT